MPWLIGRPRECTTEHYLHEEYHVPIFNMLGWFDPNKWREMIPNFDEQVFCVQMAWQQKERTSNSHEGRFFQGSFGETFLFVTGSPDPKIDGWKTIPFFLGSLAGRCFFSLGGYML